MNYFGHATMQLRTGPGMGRVVPVHAWRSLQVAVTYNANWFLWYHAVAGRWNAAFTGCKCGSGTSGAQINCGKAGNRALIKP